MAFILPAVPQLPPNVVTNLRCCSRPSVWKTIAPSVATLIVSGALLLPYPALPVEGPLIYDHDQSLAGANFENRSDLKGAIFSKSNCKEASFVGSDLSNAQLDDANVRS